MLCGVFSFSLEGEFQHLEDLVQAEQTTTIAGVKGVTRVITYWLDTLSLLKQQGTASKI